MNDETPKNLNVILDACLKLFAMAFMLANFIGGVIFYLYCFNIESFPSGFSFSDSFLFVLLFASFTIVFGLVTICLVGLGISLSPLLRPVIKLMLIKQKQPSNQPNNEPSKLVSPGSIAFSLAIFGVMFIGIIVPNNPIAILILPLNSLLFAILISQYQVETSKITGNLKSETLKVQQTAFNVPRMILDKIELNKPRLLMLFFIAIISLISVGKYIPWLDVTMSFAKIRKVDLYVMLSEPYSSLVPTIYLAKSKQAPSISDYTTFERVDIALTGIGENTVIEFNNNSSIQHLIIPNENIFYVSR